VIATVILVAVTIVCAISASFWMGGIADTYMKNERLEVSCRVSPGAVSGWNVVFTLKNVGPTTISFDEPLINGVPVSEYAEVTAMNFTTLASGVKATPDPVIEILSGWSAGTTIEIEIRTSSGMGYPLLVGLT